MNEVNARPVVQLMRDELLGLLTAAEHGAAGQGIYLHTHESRGLRL